MTDDSGAGSSGTSRPVAIRAEDAPSRKTGSNYPEPFASRVADRIKKPLGDVFGLKTYGVNLTTLPPGSLSALRHGHTKQEEFIYILEGTPILVTDAGETPLSPGMCAGFTPAGGDAHHLVNRSEAEVVYLEIGDRTAGDMGRYPDDDLVMTTDADGQRCFTHKDGTPY